VLLGYPDVEGALRELLGEGVQPVPEGMAALMATMRSSASASATRALAKTLV
jgi:hypothetical protein